MNISSLWKVVWGFLFYLYYTNKPDPTKNTIYRRIVIKDVHPLSVRSTFKANLMTIWLHV